MTASVVRIDQFSGGVAILTLDRPPVNALNPAFLEAMVRALIDLEGNVEVRALVITGAGKSFSAGMDLKELQNFSEEDQTSMVDLLSHVLIRLYGFQKPVIAAVNGHAIAGGLILPLATDFRISSEGARLGLAEVRVGVRFPLVALAIMRQELSPDARRRLVLSGNRVTASVAERLGFIDEVVDGSAVMERARAVAEDFSKIPPHTFAAVKLQLRSDPLNAMKDITAHRSDPLLRGWFTDETKDAARAILDARLK